MFELITFGRISLRRVDSRRTVDLLRHPKQLALLIYLAVEARPAMRDELIGLFWPDTTEQRARQSLSRAVSSLRCVLGTTAIITDGSVGRHIAPDVVHPDTASFDAAFAAKRWSEVVTLYHGAFLEGFVLPDANEFEGWTSRTRERYRQRAARAAQARAEELRAKGDMLEAASTLADASEIAPERVDLAAATIEAFTEAGQALAAVEWFARYTRRFEETLDEPPNPALAARVNQLRAAARNAIAPTAVAHNRADHEAFICLPQPGNAGRVGLPPPALPNDPSDTSTQQLSSWGAPVVSGSTSNDSVRKASPLRSSLRSSRPPHRSHAAIAGTMGVVLALGGAIWLSVGDTAEAESHGPTTMLINIVNRTPDIGWRHLAQSLEETLAGRMSNPPRLYVAIRPARIGQAQATRSAANGLPRPPREYVDFILAGAVHQTAERIRIDLRISDGVSNRAIRNLRVDRPRRDLFALLDETAEELADTLRPLLGSAIRSRRARSRTSSTTAWSDLEHSKALLADAQGFAALGAGAQAAALLEIADSLARRATQADPRWVDARLQLAQIERGRSIVQLAGASSDQSAPSEHLAGAAAILSDAASRWPDEVRVHQLAGTVSFERWIVAPPRDKTEHLLDEAVRSLERAILLDPYAARPWVTLSDVHAAQGDHAASAVAAQQALERDAFDEHTDELHNRLFHAHFELHQDEDAARWCDEINRRGPGRALGAFCELNLQGWSSIREPNLVAADSLIDNLDADPPALTAVMRPRLRMLQAAVAARQGETEAARRLLDSANADVRLTGDTGAASFFAAALVSLGELDSARHVLADRIASGGDRVLVERWFQELAETDRLKL